MLMGEEPTPAADIYSLGVVLWEICCQEMPQRGRRRDPTPQEAPLVCFDTISIITHLVDRQCAPNASSCLPCFWPADALQPVSGQCFQHFRGGRC